MTKLEIVKQIARETGIEATTVSAVVEGFMEEVRAAQIRKENVFCAASAPSPSNTTRKRRRVTSQRIRRSKFPRTTFLHSSLLPPSSVFWKRNDCHDSPIRTFESGSRRFIAAGDRSGIQARMVCEELLQPAAHHGGGRVVLRSLQGGMSPHRYPHRARPFVSLQQFGVQ